MKMILLLCACLLGALPAQAQVKVIANKSVAESSLNGARVASIYSLEMTKWPDGTRIVVIDQSGDAKDDFYSAIGKDPLALRKSWLKKQLTGEAKAPETVGSDAEVVRKVAATPGAVGYVRATSVTSEVKVLCELK